MQNRLALAIAAAATLLVLVVGVGIAHYLGDGDSSTGTLAAPAVAVQADPVSDQPSIEQQVQSLIDSREAGYRQALNDANSKLQQANAQLEQAYAIIDSLKQEAVTAPSAPTSTPTDTPQPTPTLQDQTAQAAQSAQADSAPGYAIRPEQAAAIALNIEPSGQLLQAPGLVSFQGTTAYEVQLDLGNVYVGANSGLILYDGAAAPQIITPNNQNRGRDENGGDEGNG